MFFFVSMRTHTVKGARKCTGGRGCKMSSNCLRVLNAGGFIFDEELSLIVPWLNLSKSTTFSTRD